MLNLLRNLARALAGWAPGLVPAPAALPPAEPTTRTLGVLLGPEYGVYELARYLRDERLYVRRLEYEYEEGGKTLFTLHCLQGTRVVVVYFRAVSLGAHRLWMALRDIDPRYFRSLPHIDRDRGDGSAERLGPGIRAYLKSRHRVAPVFPAREVVSDEEAALTADQDPAKFATTRKVRK